MEDRRSALRLCPWYRASAARPLPFSMTCPSASAEADAAASPSRLPLQILMQEPNQALGRPAPSSLTSIWYFPGVDSAVSVMRSVRCAMVSRLPNPASINHQDAGKSPLLPCGERLASTQIAVCPFRRPARTDAKPPRAVRGPSRARATRSPAAAHDGSPLVQAPRPARRQPARTRATRSPHACASPPRRRKRLPARRRRPLHRRNHLPAPQTSNLAPTRPRLRLTPLLRRS